MYIYIRNQIVLIYLVINNEIILISGLRWRPETEEYRYSIYLPINKKIILGYDDQNSKIINKETILFSDLWRKLKCINTSYMCY